MITLTIVLFIIIGIANVANALASIAASNSLRLLYIETYKIKDDLKYLNECREIDRKEIARLTQEILKSEREPILGIRRNP